MALEVEASFDGVGVGVGVAAGTAMTAEANAMIVRSVNFMLRRI